MKKKWLVFGVVAIVAALGMTALVPVAADSPAAVYPAPGATDLDTVTVMIMEQAPTDAPDDSAPVVLGTPIPEDEPVSQPTDEPTAESTEPAPIDIDINLPPQTPATPAETGINWSTVFYAAITAILGGGTIGAILSRFGQNSGGLDAAEKLYQGLSPESQSMFRTMFQQVNELTLKVLDLANKITDGLPNSPDSPAVQAAKRYKQEFPPAGDEGSEFKG